LGFPRALLLLIVGENRSIYTPGRKERKKGIFSSSAKTSGQSSRDGEEE